MRRATRWLSRLAGLACVVTLWGCDEGGPVSIASVNRGRAVFADPAFSESQFNVFSCATCHATDDRAPGVAYSLAGTTQREAWWGGKVRTLRDAADFCWVYFMRGFPALDPTTDDARALFDYLASLAPPEGTSAPLPALPLTIVEATTDPGRGDATRGAATYDRACRVCHGDPVTGDGRLGPDVVAIPGASQALAAQLGVDARLVVTEKIRHGQFFGVGGNMPFYPIEVLSDADLADLLEYLDP